MKWRPGTSFNNSAPRSTFDGNNFAWNNLFSLNFVIFLKSSVCWLFLYRPYCHMRRIINRCTNNFHMLKSCKTVCLLPNINKIDVISELHYISQLTWKWSVALSQIIKPECWYIAYLKSIWKLLLFSRFLAGVVHRRVDWLGRQCPSWSTFELLDRCQVGPWVGLGKLLGFDMCSLLWGSREPPFPASM